MKIEILFPEVCNLFGDLMNMTYLKQCLPDATFIETDFDAEPVFLSEDVDMIYMGPMTERTQEAIIKKFAGHQNRICDMISRNVIFLFTGNALEIFGTYIENEDGSRIEALGIYPYSSKRNLMKRHNSTFMGKFNGEYLIGHKTQFTFSYPEDESHGFANVIKGVGMNPGAKMEGYCDHNFFGTYLVGPILIMNPPFTKFLISRMNILNVKLAHCEAVTSAYEKRLQDFHQKT